MTLREILGAPPMVRGGCGLRVSVAEICDRRVRLLMGMEAQRFRRDRNTEKLIVRA